MSDLDADVIVVGCGPVGVMTALRCAQRGLRVIAIDRSTEVYPLPRAIGMDDEIQQLFARAGLIEQLGQHSGPLRGGEFVDAAGERVVGIELPEGTVGPLGHPPIVTFDQPGLERALREAARARGVGIRLGIDATGLHVDDGTVRLDISDGSTDDSVRARWLVGADGAKSTIRSLNDVPKIDQGFDQTWLVVDTTLTDPDLPLPPMARQHCDPARIATFVPGFGTRRRWEFQLRPDETREQVLAESAIAELLSPWGSEEQLRVDRAAVYRFHATVAERFRRGPVFLAGDAAHQMPPFNGQGMCSGMRDAENLSWKLAHVALGLCGDELLETYDAERRPHAAEQVGHSVDAGMLMEAIAHDGEAALESGYGQRPFPQLAHGIVDGDHPFVGRPLPEPIVGTGPMSDGWTLVRSEPDDVPALWSHLGAAVFDAKPGAYPGLVDAGVTVVVRPDRYIAAVTTDLAATTERLARTVAPQATPSMQGDPR
jgi:3-(3-hydroxy-phenyl)propionate hydroxylase